MDSSYGAIILYEGGHVVLGDLHGFRKQVRGQGLERGELVVIVGTDLATGGQDLRFPWY